MSIDSEGPHLGWVRITRCQICMNAGDIYDFTPSGLMYIEFPWAPLSVSEYQNQLLVLDRAWHKPAVPREKNVARKLGRKMAKPYRAMDEFLRFKAVMFDSFVSWLGGAVVV